jgi:NADH pyrophosphatase NudC (nudix superfamily)
MLVKNAKGVSHECWSLLRVSSTIRDASKTRVALGGHVEQVESLEAGRELLEETGIKRAVVQPILPYS